MTEEALQIHEKLKNAVLDRNVSEVSAMIAEMEAVDIAEFFESLDTDGQTFLYDLMTNEQSAEMLLEIDEDKRKKFLSTLSSKEIADEIINEIDSDDAADIIAELPEHKQDEIIQHLDDVEHAQNIVDLLRYDEDTAGGLMATELVKVNQDLSIISAVKEMRKQAEEMEEVYSIYVVDNSDKLLGTLSLKKLLTTSSSTRVSDVFNSKVRSVKDSEEADEVARQMQKYDLFEVPVIDSLGKLVGRITIDDVMDFVKEETEKDYQLASGISSDIDNTDNIFNMTKARLPWLFIGMVGGLIGSRVLQGNESALQNVPALMFFVPLIAATAGNIGVQASAIIVQGLANNTLGKDTFRTLAKEISVSAASGMILSLIIFAFNLLVNHQDFTISMTISISLLAVILVAAVIGTIVPIILDKNKIDPAIATGPFITTSNDILGVLIYFSIAKMMLHI
ncbi:Magnesium transporter mgtE [Chryseobacterium taklimakanense]|uniref:Magnesium transporter MgtE n=1 Tax=Chryseobacterium taklimakanense TaxID=536441 RepID=A0A239WGB0_9FLAO|nr:magnesium transporter [Chryseobacterium taklimakanense]SNV33462.1 Magnesium transporter mgtE [Chryseobacterium taklimakanense]